jgi:hypothetical protein
MLVDYNNNEVKKTSIQIIRGVSFEEIVVNNLVQTKIKKREWVFLLPYRRHFHPRSYFNACH